VDSVHQRGLDITLEEVLTVVQSGGGGWTKMLESSKIGNVFANSKTRGDME
jgi:hypothetical protein